MPCPCLSHMRTKQMSHTKIDIAASTQIIERAGHKIAFHDTPGGLPVIVLDAGGGLGSSYWDALLPQLAKRTGSRIITYDRSGFGLSDEVEGPWNVHDAANDLASGLEKLGATQDVILVAHSIAGEIATYLARQHPQWISGAVLVDANVPDFFTETTIAAMMEAYGPAIAATKAAPSTREGRQFLAVCASFAENNRAFHQVDWPASIPVFNIVAEKTPFDAPVPAQWWRDAQASFASGANNRRLVIADGSSHDVALDRPDVILQSIEDIIALSRRDVYQRLAALGISLPPVTPPAAIFVPFVQTGNLIFISGHIAKRDGKPWVGRLGRDTSTAQGQAAAKSIAIDLIGTLHSATGNLNRISRIVKVMSLVNSTHDFVEQHLVTNGCSELLAEVFAERGAHARSAFGVAQLPMGACVEIELIAELA